MKKNEFKELLTSRTYGKAGQLAAPNWKGAPDRSGWYKREMIVQ